MMCEQLEFDFGPDFPKEQIRRDTHLHDILLDVEIAIARSDYAAVRRALQTFKLRAWDMFWGELRS
jgi:hypothetical protein